MRLGKHGSEDINMPEALAGRDDESRPGAFTEGITDTVGATRERDGLDQWASPEIASGMQNLDEEQRNLDTMFEGEDESALSEDDRIYRDQLQGELDGRREMLMAENDRIRMQDPENPEPDEDDITQNPELDEDDISRNPELDIERNEEINKHPIRRAVGTAMRTRAKSVLGIGSTPKQTLKNNAKRYIIFNCGCSRIQRRYRYREMAQPERRGVLCRFQSSWRNRTSLPEDPA